MNPVVIMRSDNIARHYCSVGSETGMWLILKSFRWNYAQCYETACSITWSKPRWRFHFHAMWLWYRTLHTMQHDEWYAIVIICWMVCPADVAVTSTGGRCLATHCQEGQWFWCLEACTPVPRKVCPIVPQCKIHYTTVGLLYIMLKMDKLSLVDLEQGVPIHYRPCP